MPAEEALDMTNAIDRSSSLHEVDVQTRLNSLLAGYMPVQLAYAMARLRLADVLDGRSLSLIELSGSTCSQPKLMRRLVRGLAGIGLLEFEHDRVSLTEMGALLRTRAAGSMRDVALHRGGESYAAWGNLAHTVRTGEPAFDAAHGEPFFTYMRRNRDAGAAFDGTMTQLSEGVVEEAIGRYDFDGTSRILDVGGGRGHFVAGVLAAHPHLEGAVFDVAEVATEAAWHVRRAGLGARCEVIAGSFFEELPTGYDVHILKWILHDWDDASCRELLATCRAALPIHGRLLVVERLLPDAGPPPGRLHPTVTVDLTMLVNFADARERHLGEYEQLIESSGFAIHRIVPLPSGFSILDCRPSET